MVSYRVVGGCSLILRVVYNIVRWNFYNDSSQALPESTLYWVTRSNIVHRGKAKVYFATEGLCFINPVKIKRHHSALLVHKYIIRIRLKMYAA